MTGSRDDRPRRRDPGGAAPRPAREPRRHTSPAERRALRARGHGLRPAVTIGAAGLTPAVAAELERALESRELVKIKLPPAARAARAALVLRVCEAAGAEPVQSLGRTALVYRPRDAGGPAGAEPEGDG